MPLPAVLIVDSDLGFIVWLSYELHKRNIQALPARTIEEARTMLAHFRSEPDLLIMNCSIPDTCRFARELAEERPNAAIIGIISDGNGCKGCADVLTAQFHDPSDKA